MNVEFEKEICDGDWKAEADLEASMKPAKHDYEFVGKVKFQSAEKPSSRARNSQVLELGKVLRISTVKAHEQNLPVLSRQSTTIIGE